MRAAKAFWWDENGIVSLMQRDVKDMSREELEFVATELDRRMMQLWDKVIFERNKGLLK